MVPISTLKVKRALFRQQNMFGARIKIVWEEQLVDPAVEYITYLNIVEILIKV